MAKESLNIAFVTLSYTPFRTSGLAVGGERVVRALLDAGHRVSVIAAAPGRLTETHIHPSLSIYRLPVGRSNWIGYAYRAAQALHRLNNARPFDVVHFSDVHFAYAYRGTYVANLHHSFRQRLSIVNHSRRLPVQQVYYNLAQKLAERPAIGRAAGLLAVSSAVRDEFIHSYGVAPGRITVAPYGVDTEFFRPRPEAVELRRRLGIAEHEPVLLFVGFITPRKGLDYLAQALLRTRPAPRLVLAGRWDEEYRSQFLQMLCSTADRLVEVGYVPDEQLPAYYSLANVYVSASLMEGFGLTIAEALACQTPVVAADAGSVAEVVGPGGVLVPPRDPGALADAISHMLKNPELRRNLGQQGRAHVMRTFSIEAMLRATLDSYSRFLRTQRFL
jgi:glycosyltransferase involved in cell wall biosynthesis